MKLSTLFGNRMKENPKDAELVSHALMLRAGYIRQNASGIYSYLPLMKKVMRKIETIIREEMDSIDGQEILMPYVQTKEMWEKTGRYFSVKEELVRFSDRQEKGLVLAMTHEEAVSFLAKTELFSYRQLPLMVYQLQLKFRDEPRCRGGLIRVREFTMKDAYSFHLDDECLKKYYNKVFEAYNQIFQRCGLKNFISVQSDTGMMGGKIAHEFMLVTESGEDTLILCNSCDYKANKDVAYSKIECAAESQLTMEEVHTPGKKTIEEVAAFLNVPKNKTGKTIFYVTDTSKLIFVLIRGDREVNETKLKKILGTAFLRFAEDSEIRAIGAEPGYASILNLKNDKVHVIVDATIKNSTNLVVGANRIDYHIKNFNWERDSKLGDIHDIASVEEGDPCPVCSKSLMVKRGIEIGNIFQLGTKYTKDYSISVLNEKGQTVTPLMGCYGIGVGRLAASVVEESHDQYGIVWPLSVAPFEVHINCLTPKDENIKQYTDLLHNELMENNIGVLYDDRDESVGVKFSDADLIGIPFHIIYSKKLAEEGKVEIKVRKNNERIKIAKSNVVKTIKDMIEIEMMQYKK